MKNNNLFLYFLLNLACWPAQAATILAPKTILMPTRIIAPITARNTVFLWDFHDVIVKRNLNETISTVWNSEKKFQIIKATSKNLLWNAFRIIGKSITSSTCSEEFIQLVKQNNNPLLEELIYEVANIQEPIPGTIQLIQDLHNAGYHHYIGSNIGTSIFQKISNPEKYPQFASLFANFNLEHPQTVSCDLTHPETTIKKPDLRFFQDFLRKNAVDLQKTNVIFIDDSLKNVRAAQKAGLIGIHFKNPEQLRADLTWLGLNIDFPLISVV